MTKQPYYVLPGVEWVNGARVPANRIVMLTDDEAEFDLYENRIVPGVSPPAGVDPEAAVTSVDLITMRRDGRVLSFTIEELVAFLAGRFVPGASLTLSTVFFPIGAASGSFLADINAPPGWLPELETTFSGRVRIDGNDLVAAQLLSAAATGSVRIRAVSPDGKQAIVRTFDLTIGDAQTPPVVTPPVVTPTTTIPIGVATGLLHGLPFPIAA